MTDRLNFWLQCNNQIYCVLWTLEKCKTYSKNIHSAKAHSELKLLLLSAIFYQSHFRELPQVRLVVQKVNLWQLWYRFLQALFPSCHPSNSIKALKGKHIQKQSVITTSRFIIRLEARLRPSIGNILSCVWTVFMRLAITPPEMNQFGWNLGRSEYIVCRWPWHILGAIRTELRVRERGQIVFCQVSNSRFHRLPVDQISRNLHARRGSVSRWILSEHNFENFPYGVIFSKKGKFFTRIFNNLSIPEIFQ